jgi:hypothetical protein
MAVACESAGFTCRVGFCSVQIKPLTFRVDQIKSSAISGRDVPDLRILSQRRDGIVALDLVYIAESRLPPMAWCALHRRGERSVTIIHGDGVETHADWFFEGPWSGPFEAAALPESYRFGSGAIRRDGQLIYLPPCHTLARLHFIERDDRLVVANSLPFALAVAGDSLRNDYPFYARDLYSVRRGLRHARTVLPLATSRVRLAYHDPQVVDAALAVRPLPRTRAEAPFADFAQYHAFLTRQLAGLIANGADPRRRRKFEPITTLSSGYDSTAGAALVAPLGCREAISFRAARKSSGGDADDSGAAAASALGLKRHEFEWDGYKRRPGAPEIEFFAANPTAEDVSFAACEELLPGRLLFVGYHGDAVWSPGKTNAPDFVRGDASGGSLDEFRMRVGFALAPFAFIGAEWQARINEIGASPDMDPWRVGGSYDRPIPRRLAERAGVPRTAFGQAKKAVSVAYALRGARNRPTDERLTPRSRDDFHAFVAGAGLARRTTQRLIAAETATDLWVRVVNRVNWVLKLGRLPWKLKRPFRQYGLHVGEDWSIVHWAVGRLASRYADAVSGLRSAADAGEAPELLQASGSRPASTRR